MASRFGIRGRVAASYGGQTYVVILGLAITPIFFRYLGPSAYGLVGIFTMIQQWLQLLDGGFSATLARETTRYGSGQTTAEHYRSLVILLSRIFLGTALAFVIVGLIGSEWIASHWLKTGNLPRREVWEALAIIIITAGIRWRTEPYRSVIIGFEHTVWLNAVTSFFATIRYVGAALLVVFVTHLFIYFFLYQLICAALEAAIVIYKAYSLVPSRHSIGGKSVSLPSLKPFLRFAASVAITAILSSGAWQVDKVILSRLLPLRDYGVFTLAIVAATGVSLLSMPVNQALSPRLTALKSLGRDDEFRQLYRRSTSFVSALIGPACMCLVAFGPQVIWVWTGDAVTAAAAAPIVRWYAIGEFFAAFIAFTYYLQYAYGNLRLHVIGSAAFFVCILPCVYLAAMRFGAVGTGFVWFAANAVYLGIWSYIVHRRFEFQLRWTWFYRDIMVTALPGVVICVLAAQLRLPWYGNRITALGMLLAVGLVSVMSCMALVPGARVVATAVLSRMGGAIRQATHRGYL